MQFSGEVPIEVFPRTGTAFSLSPPEPFSSADEPELKSEPLYLDDCDVAFEEFTSRLFADLRLSFYVSKTVVQRNAIITLQYFDPVPSGEVLRRARHALNAYGVNAV